MIFSNRFVRWAGVLALVACIAFSVTGCNMFGGGSDDSGGVQYYQVRTNLDFPLPAASGTGNLVASPLPGATVAAIVYDGAYVTTLAMQESPANSGQYVCVTPIGNIKSIVISATQGRKVLRNMVVSPSQSGNVFNCGVTNPTSTGFAQMMVKLVGIADDGSASAFNAGFFGDSLSRMFTINGVQKSAKDLDTDYRTSDLFSTYRNFWNNALAQAETAPGTTNIINVALTNQNFKINGQTANEMFSGYSQTVSNWIGLTDFFFNGIAGVINNNETTIEKRVYRTITVTLPPSVPYAGTVKYTLFGKSVVVPSVGAGAFVSGGAVDLSVPTVFSVYGYGAALPGAETGTAATTNNQIVNYLVTVVRSGMTSNYVTANAATSEDLKKLLASDVQVINLTADPSYEYDLSDMPVAWVNQGAANGVVTNAGGNKQLISSGTVRNVVFHGSDIAHLIGDPNATTYTSNGVPAITIGQQVIDSSTTGSVRFILAARTQQDVTFGLAHTAVTAATGVDFNRINEVRLMSSCTLPGAAPAIQCASITLNLNGYELTNLKATVGQLANSTINPATGLPFQATLNIVSQRTVSPNRRASIVAMGGALHSASITGIDSADPAAAVTYRTFNSALLLDNNVNLVLDAADAVMTFDNMEVTLSNAAQLQAVLNSNGKGVNQDSLKIHLGGVATTYALTATVKAPASRVGFGAPARYAIEIDLNGKTLDLGGNLWDYNTAGAANSYGLNIYGSGTIQNGVLQTTGNALYQIASGVIVPATGLTVPKSLPNTVVAVVTDATTFNAAVTAKSGTIVVANDIDLGDNVVTFNTDTRIYSQSDVVRTVKARNFVSAYSADNSRYFNVNLVSLISQVNAPTTETVKTVFLQAVVNNESQLRDSLDLTTGVNGYANKIYLNVANITLNQSLNVSTVYAITGVSGATLTPVNNTINPVVNLSGIMTDLLVPASQSIKITGIKFAASTTAKSATNQVLFQTTTNTGKVYFDTCTFTADGFNGTDSYRAGYQAVAGGSTINTQFANCAFTGLAGANGYAIYVDNGNYLKGSTKNTFTNCAAGILVGAANTKYLDGATVVDANQILGFTTTAANTFTGGFGPDDSVATGTTASSAVNALALGGNGVNYHQAGDFVQFGGASGYVNGISYDYENFTSVIPGATETQVFAPNATNTWAINFGGLLNFADGTTDSDGSKTILTYILPMGKTLTLTPRQVSRSFSTTSPTFTALPVTSTAGKLAVTLPTALSANSMTITGNYVAGVALIQVTCSDRVYYFQVKVQ
ncbi:MAG: hypothetical protein HQM08_01755 [Candidatus Riflebacteria bacterium]|nr:hypothetical protein [Candidatus Riflebacteria bacterium]